jgi:uncharacterized protein YbbK (DUF523 family)
MILVSGCLSGNNSFYNGESKVCVPIKKLVEENKAIPVCPELLGGLTVPREHSEIKGGTGSGVLAKKCKVVTKSGKDVTTNFIAGGEAVLSLVKKYNIKKAILKSRSPACGCGKIYDGSFTGKLIKGDGVTCALLKINGIKVINDEEFLGHTEL